MTSSGRKTPTGEKKPDARAGQTGEPARTPLRSKRRPRIASESPEIISPRPQRARRLSSTEVIYPDPETAKQVFEAERAHKPLHRRVPTPYASSRLPRATVCNVGSRGSIKSRVSFESTRSQPSDPSGTESDGTILGPWDPPFGATHGIGPVGEAIEVIDLGRKEPRHRKFQAGMLKPAIRSTSRVNSHADIRHSTFLMGTRDKPLPSRPLSYIAPHVDMLSRTHPSRSHSRHASHQGPLERRPSSSRLHKERLLPQPPLSSLRSLFSSFTLDSSASSFGPRSPLSRINSRSRQPVVPAEDVFGYLRGASIPPWNDWPMTSSRGKSRGFFGAGASKGFEEMGWEWTRRFQAAESGRISGRALRKWEAALRGWERRVMEFCEDNVPTHPIDTGNRWGSQIFALPADGYETLDYFDDTTDDSQDSGLLSWMTGTVLQTAVSVLHMLRYSSQTFTFHLIPGPQPQSSYGFDESPSRGAEYGHALVEGYGTLALVNKNNDIDRAMIVEVRPSSVVSSGVMREFARDGRQEGWWHLPGEHCIGDIGQADLLQAQVYDDCVQNQVYFFAVTNLKQWVFGLFSSNYSMCTVGPVVERKQRDPSVMQCLAAWLIRSVDERPRANEPTVPAESLQRHASHREVPPHSELRNRHHRNASYDFSPFQNQSYPQMQANTISQASFPHPVSPIQQDFSPYTGPPGYFDVPQSMTSAPFPFSQYGGHGMLPSHNTWSPAQRHYSPVTYNGGGWYGSGFPWGGMR